jgi:hypothetical protein
MPAPRFEFHEPLAIVGAEQGKRNVPAATIFERSRPFPPWPVTTPKFQCNLQLAVARRYGCSCLRRSRRGRYCARAGRPLCEWCRCWRGGAAVMRPGREQLLLRSTRGPPYASFAGVRESASPGKQCPMHQRVLSVVDVAATRVSGAVQAASPRRFVFSLVLLPFARPGQTHVVPGSGSVPHASRAAADRWCGLPFRGRLDPDSIVRICADRSVVGTHKRARR